MKLCRNSDPAGYPRQAAEAESALQQAKQSLLKLLDDTIDDQTLKIYNQLLSQICDYPADKTGEASILIQDYYLAQG